MRTCKVVIPYSLCPKPFVSYALVIKSDNPNAIATMAPMYAAPEIIKLSEVLRCEPVTETYQTYLRALIPLRPCP